VSQSGSGLKEMRPHQGTSPSAALPSSALSCLPRPSPIMSSLQTTTKARSPTGSPSPACPLHGGDLGPATPSSDGPSSPQLSQQVSAEGGWLCCPVGTVPEGHRHLRAGGARWSWASLSALPSTPLPSFSALPSLWPLPCAFSTYTPLSYMCPSTLTAAGGLE
jgi:hypothetical protein